MNSDNGDSHICISVIVPVYNEQTRVTESLGEIKSYLNSKDESYEIILVDDGSTDGTLEIARKIGNGSTRIVSYEHNMGKGYAVRQGVYAARGEYIAFTDVDLSAPIDQLSKLFSAIEDSYDVAIGSRAVKGAEIPVHQPLYRELGGKALNLAIQMLAVPGIKDTQCGFKLFKGDAARKIFSKCFINGWGFDVEVLFLARKLGYKTAEIPVKWSHMAGSKLHPFRGALRVIADVIRMRLRG
ncbi:glycosyltransferase family 2 protein [bacterium]|nr:glycosyltransferase family 2 protein [bacterium]